MEKYSRAGKATDDNWRMRIACWITNATDTHSEYAILIASPLQQWLRKNTPHCYVIRTPRVLLNIKLLSSTDFDR